MNEEELFFLVSVTVVMPIVALWIILNYQKARMKLKHGQPDNSLTTSELNSLIDESVAEATEPLNDRVSELERQVRLLNPDSGRLAADLSDEESESDPQPVKTLGKTRT